MSEENAAEPRGVVQDVAPDAEPASEQPLGGAYVPEIRPAMEDVCCGSGCAGCPTYWGE